MSAMCAYVSICMAVSMLVCVRECVCVCDLPVVRVWRGHGSGYITHLKWYAPPVALQRQGGLGWRARRVT